MGPPRAQHQPRASGGITVMVAVAPPLVAELISDRLELEPDITVTHTMSTSEELRANAGDAVEDVICVDPRLVSSSLMAFAKGLGPADDGPHIVIVANAMSDLVVMDAIRAGCSSFASTEMEATDLVLAVRAAQAGHPHMGEDLLARFAGQVASMPDAPSSALTKRERQVLNLVAEGMSGRSVAEQLGLSVNTVRHHTQSILTKLGVHSKIEAVTVAVRLGIIPPRS